MVRHFIVVVALLAVSGVGCARAVIHKVPSRADYESWSDEQQRAVDSMCGLRFYRSRPYVVVKRPFVVDSRTYFVDAVMGDDGRHARLVGCLPKALSSGLMHAGVPMRSAGEGKDLEFGVKTDAIWRDFSPPATPSPATPSTPPSSPPSGREAAPATPGDDPAAPAAPAAGTSPGPTPAPGTGTAPDSPPATPSGADRTVPALSTGISDVELNTDGNAFYKKNLQDSLDVVYLPDFEEEYVVSQSANLGNLDVDLTQGPGGVLMQINMRVDNHQITDPIVNQYQRMIAAAGEAVTKGISVAGGAESGVIMPSGLPATRKLEKGAVVTLRIHVVRYANEGIYPILKAKEVIDHRRRFRNLNAYDCGDCGSCATCTTAREMAAPTHWMPVYPYSRVAYQFHTSVLIQEIMTRDTRPPRFAESAAWPRSMRESAPAEAGGISNAAIERMINDALASDCATQCVSVQVVGRSPETSSIAELTELKLRFNVAGAAVDQYSCYVTAAMQKIRGLGFPKAMVISVEF